ncbi:LacI family DNA-binding transcriptional regulator [Microbulbifer thermotolerans]|uniref:LacI family transcriptional regulator n=1 Tax=Microbulbifer thermotolerans TaxID=252514 RepID=A0A143HKG8_MICTH|nr:LacI family DNA-binding transcriptional regulator [Microbulbifer thermotolerans]AMX01986.1 LacI family transcriptional regulator [Microbulbifer thermotolerans]MCX2783151.1 LacI family DNA-binding transcriptional regulator [Microbulbifer thermotolerans]MCX2834206.1 LacI family DNA-binding transcriptional regulator [Microbulbifer thermotolerans]WKT61530.1 LacI family DNA-binding transcriptional regulator [Microbulbifer thermotolerans]SFB68415.1 transcriptional regulator, LacI family [Microbul
MKVTINDVAAQAGVSIKTVSRVINNEPSVRPATRKKVIDAVEALNYQPNLAARNLAGTRSYTIAFIYDNPNAYYVIDMQNGILEACRARGYELLIHPSNAKSDAVHDELKNLVRHSRIAGLVLTPPFSEDQAIIDTVRSLDLHYVRILSAAAAEDDEENCIQVDDNGAAYALTKHLLELNHRRIGFLCGSEGHISTRARLDGYRRALREAGLPIEKELILKGEYAFDSGVEGAKKLLQSANPPTAIFASNDEIAAGALFAARLMDIKIPEQLSIVGFEDSPFSRQTWPKLTTAHQPNNEIAKCAAALVLNKARSKGTENGKAHKEAGIQKEFTPELVIRDSSGPAPG